MEHSCHVCGNALRRTAALRDVHYGLPVVVCGSCGTACVRRRHPLSVAGRAARRLRNALWGIAWRGMAVFLVVWGSYALAGSMADAAGGVRVGDLLRYLAGIDEEASNIRVWMADNGTAVLVSAVLWFVGVGAAVTAGLGHLRRVVVVALMLAVMAAAPPAYAVARTEIRLLESGGRADMRGAFVSEMRRLRPTIEFAGLGMVVAIAGVVPGRMVRRVMDRRVSAAWVARVKRARAKRRAL